MYVDDIIIRTSDMQYMVEIKSRILDRYDMTDMGRLTSFLIKQATICKKVLRKHAGLVGTSSKKNPLPSNAMDMLAEDTGNYSREQSDFVKKFPYRELVGATLYLAMHTRPDVAFVVRVLSRQWKQPSLAACTLMVYLLRCIQGSTDKDIRFSGNLFDLHVFSTSDWAGDRVTWRYTTGYIVFSCGGPIMWQSKLYTTVSTSSMQAENQDMYAGMQELV